MTTSQRQLIPLSIGERLRQRRIERKLSLEQVASAIHYDEKILGEIEEDRADHVAAIYLRGYLRAYARFLAFSQEEIQEIVQLAQDRMEQLAAPVRSIFPKPARRRPADRWLHATSYVLASLLIGTLAWQFSREAVRLSQVGAKTSETRQDVPVAQASQEQNKTQREPVAASIAPLGALHAGEAGNFDPARQAWTAMSRPALPEGFNRLSVSVSADSWVEIMDADGQSLEMDLVRAGSEKTYQGRQPYQILLGRASAVRLFVNDKRIDIAPFTRNDVARLNWPIAATGTGNGAGKD